METPRVNLQVSITIPELAAFVKENWEKFPNRNSPGTCVAAAIRILIKSNASHIPSVSDALDYLHMQFPRSTQIHNAKILWENRIQGDLEEALSEDAKSIMDMLKEGDEQ